VGQKLPFDGVFPKSSSPGGGKTKPIERDNLNVAFAAGVKTQWYLRKKLSMTRQPEDTRRAALRRVRNLDGVVKDHFSGAI
jgi:hypothetical protein